ncbi:extracellular solute-binding protein [Chloroflexi bacterium TSY]|nr:extracellular solute-binding protein [Chloroflexi bacterium TSY]
MNHVFQSKDGTKPFWQPILVLTLLALLLTACWGSDDEEPVVSSTESKTELRYISFGNNDQVEKELLRQFEEAQPTLDIKAAPLNSWPQAYLRDEEPPDIMAIPMGSWLFIGLDEGLLADLSDVMEQTEAAEGYQGAIQELTMRGGRQYFLSAGYSWNALYYNREVFNELGIEPPQSWDELIVVADTLLANGVIPFVMPWSDEWLASLWFDYLDIRLNGPVFHRQLIQGEITFTDERLFTVFETWQTLIDKGYFTTDIGIDGDLDSLLALIRGDKDDPLTREKAAMALLPSTSITDLPDIFASELTFFRFPVFNSDIPLGEVVGAIGYLVPANAPNRLEAMTFIAHMLQPETAATFAQFQGSNATFVPATDKVDFDLLSIEAQQGLMLLERAEDVTQRYVWAAPTDVRISMTQAIGRFLRNATREPVDINDLLAKLEEDRLKALEKGAYFR